MFASLPQNDIDRMALSEWQKQTGPFYADITADVSQQAQQHQT
jgi:hypothetical protein